MEWSGERKKCTYCYKTLPVEVFTLSARTGKRISKCPSCNAKHLESCQQSKIRKRQAKLLELNRGDLVQTWLCSRCGEQPVSEFDFNPRLQRYQTNCRTCMPKTTRQCKEYKAKVKALLFMAEVTMALADPILCAQE